MTASPTILLLDDEFMVALALAEHLESEGFAIAGPFCTVEEADAHVALNRPDAAFLDINLGNGTNSYDFAARLKRDGVPFCFLTGYSDLQASHPDLKDSCFLGKPVRPEKVAQTAQKMVA
ncbi:response regulator [Aurantiacibacter rhizosphaerae]|uniref:Response regulator n=1 Tax=Aurantiacibacter rhizosphaerae TaxID=2691582 RepID=A0A844XHA9_9SPHN|nr:response regulator [Aurantiacibacter rhizosphaerae]MWV28954.1 response regulator [Aurantiacibacter rhizosphaerae]